MELLRFINSEDIRKHLEDIEYEFNSLEAAWLIYQCRDATIREKHDAWNKLIETMPDCCIEERFNTVPQDSLHAFLKEYMKLEDKLVNEFRNEKHADTFDEDKPFVYQFKYICKKRPSYDWDTVFSCFDALYETIMEPDEDVVAIECFKMQIDRLNTWQKAVLTPSFEILHLDPGRLDNEEEENIYWGVFEGLWFEFPTPFHKGDILWTPHKPYCAGWWWFYPHSVPFVTDELFPEGKSKEWMREYGDTTDMSTNGYFLDEDGGIYRNHVGNYMDFEFYRKELTEKQKTLIAMSSFMKGDVDAYRGIQEYNPSTFLKYFTTGWHDNY